MKKITFLSTVIILSASIANAQISKGSILLGGGVSFSNSHAPGTPNSYSSNGFSISPSLGFTIKENEVLGFNLSYGHGTQKMSSTKTWESNGYGGGIFLRKHLPLGKGFYLFGQGGANFFYNKNEQKTAPFQTQKLSGGSLNLYPGIAYSVTKRFQLEAAINNLMSLTYSINKQEYQDQTGTISSKSRDFNLSVNSSPVSNLTLGFRIILPK